MANILLINQPFVSVGLDDFTHTIATDGLYYVNVQSTETPATALSIVVNQNGSPVYTAPVITPSQSAQEFKTNLKCVATDVITVVLSSTQSLSTDIDNQLNTLKTTVAIGQGQGA